MPVASVEIWGGVEGTCRRVGDTYSDQLVRSGHRDRLDDLDRFADLGLRTLRYPVLWQTVAPDRPPQLAVARRAPGPPASAGHRAQTWETAHRLHATGVELRGLTVWSLLGASDWDNLLTQDGASYETGVFDVRSGQPCTRWCAASSKTGATATRCCWAKAGGSATGAVAGC